jgi:DNA-binding GntR family transcriptional regulator
LTGRIGKIYYGICPTNTPGASVPSKYSVNYHRKILRAMRGKNAQKVYDLTFEYILVVLNAVKKLEEGRLQASNDTSKYDLG